ncbi:MAG: alpha/beta hydrolase [Sedimentisphaerales bacterium]|nr:alpha/beta hydrolase [Sedimentisphaerales bacterium]
MIHLKKRFLYILLPIVIASAILSVVFIRRFFFLKSTIKPSPYPVLLIISPQENEVSSGNPQIQKKLVVITHGWIEDKSWPCDIATAIADKVDSDEWTCAWFDWRTQSMVLNPTDAATFAKEKAGDILAEKILELSKNFSHIHLIGHSAGSWAINEAANILSKQTNSTFHLTFLDAYVPPFWDEKELGSISNDPNITCWIEHYFTHDITLAVTEILLTNAHNVDLTDANPGINSHKFPWHWYYSTVLGKYAKDQRYEGKKLYFSDGNINYGFLRSLEAGNQNWQDSLKLTPNKKDVKIIKK